MITEEDERADREGRALVAEVQPQVDLWLLMYSRYRRSVVGFYAGHVEERLIVDVGLLPSGEVLRRLDMAARIATQEPKLPAQQPSPIPVIAPFNPWELSDPRIRVAEA
ncbi:hypothetical protein [Nonomuraea sp. LPB2021202275-12-8]|uniref:hypothetical protein n=1 Tax=Nonomuraea sp. LPB2021202275-12-8 TaxID=3120159 RepID=UPI00300BFFDB